MFELGGHLKWIAELKTREGKQFYWPIVCEDKLKRSPFKLEICIAHSESLFIPFFKIEMHVFWWDDILTENWINYLCQTIYMVPSLFGWLFQVLRNIKQLITFLSIWKVVLNRFFWHKEWSNVMISDHPSLDGGLYYLYNVMCIPNMYDLA